MSAPDPKLLDALMAQLAIAHHIPGRVRFKLGAPLSEAQQRSLGDARRLTGALAGAPGIRGVSLNALARSCTVDYDPECISPTAWRDLIAGIDSPPASSLREMLAGRLKSSAPR